MTLKRTGSIELTKELVVQSRVIAKGRRIRDVQRLLDQYGDQPSQWIKKSSPVFENEGTLYEYHWYEHHAIDRFETKLKVLTEK